MDRFIKNTYLYRCLLQCQVTIDTILNYQTLIKTRQRDAQISLDDLKH